MLKITVLSYVLAANEINGVEDGGESIEKFVLVPKVMRVEHR